MNYRLLIGLVIAFAGTACGPPVQPTGSGGGLLCEVEADCLGAQTCILSSGECRDLQPGECRRDDANLCACELNSHCPDGLICGGSGLCENEGGGNNGGGNNGGGGNDAGPGGNGNDAGSGTPGDCERNTDCSIDEFCHPTARECRALPEGTCRENSQCTSNQCVIPEGRELGRCEGGAGECTEDTDCGEGEMCDEGTCVGGGGGGCASDFDCDFGQMCQDGRCVADERCFSDLSCAERQVCREMQCVDVDCTEDQHCGAGSYCQDNTCRAGEREDDHGNTFDTATNVEDNSQTMGVLNYDGDIDVFRFRSTVDGSYTVGTTGTTDTQCSLMTADGNNLATDDDSGELSNCQVSFNLVAGAIFQVQVNGFLNRTGDYTLVITRPQGGNNGGGNGGNDDHGNDAGSATRITENSTTQGSIEVAQDNDYFRFVAGATANYFIYTTSQIDTHCTLYDNNGAQITLNDDGGEDRNCRISEALTQGETYVVMVRHFSAGGTGDYSLRVERGPEDQGGDINTAQTVQLPAREAGELAQRDEDWFRFTTGAAGQYRMETDSMIDTRCKLLDAGGNELEDNDDGGALANCRIDFELAAQTTYYFAVRGFTTMTTGAFTAVIGPL